MSVIEGHVRSTARYIARDGARHRFMRGPADDRSVVFHDMRGAPDQPRLDREGFALVQHTSAVTDFSDADEVANIYLPELRKLVQQLTKSELVFMQPGWVLRADDGRSFNATRLPGGKSVTTLATGQIIHVDYTPDSAGDFAKLSFASAGLSARPKGRLVGFNFWRAITPPPQDKPLALLDRRSVDPDDFIVTDMGMATSEMGDGTFRGNQWLNYQLAYNPAHRFCWWRDMTRDEVLVFVQYEEGGGPVSGIAHTAFINPDCPPGTPPRESIEARAYAFVEN